MKEKITIRRAEEKDIDFLIKAIIEAEKSGTDKISYCNIFKVNETELKNILKEILLEDIEGQELCISGFLIAEVNEKYAGAICSWIECENEVQSKIIKANILFHYLGKERCDNAAATFGFLENIHIEREKSCLQIESVYVENEFRGMGICNKLIKEHVKKHSGKNSSFKKVQIILAKTNDNAYKAYKKIGFEIVKEKFSDNTEILSILPSNRMILMECKTPKYEV
ncbi:MAG: GNAT family N-acetyltransferase [Bacteroidales bacterium]|nr:GNAT family N-acetyltransferase [Bacteroidales bacterium]